MKRFGIIPQANDPVIKLKVPRELFAQIQSIARESGRSKEIEILLRLARSLEVEQELSGEQLLRKIFSKPAK